MNVLQLVAVYPNEKKNYSGLFLKEQALALSQKHNVIVICSCYDGSDFSAFPKYSILKSSVNENLNEIYINIPKTLPIIGLIYYLSMSLILMIKLTRGRNFSIIHCHFTWPMAFLGYLLSRYKKVPYCITENSSGFQKQFRTPFHKMVGLLSLKKADAVFAVGDSLAREVHQFIKKEVKVLYNTVNLEKFNIHVGDSNKNTGSLGNGQLTGKTLNVGFLGILNDNRKGLDLLIKALSGLPDFMLHVGGEGKALPYFKELAKEYGIYDKCIFYGAVSAADVPLFMSRLDAFVFPSRAEGFCNVIIEALASGIPVITTRLGGSDCLVNENSGFVVASENINELKDAIVKLRMIKYDPDKVRQCAEVCNYKSFTEKATEYYEEAIMNYRLSR